MGAREEEPAARKPSGRGRAVLAIDWWPAELPEGTRTSPQTLIAHDGEVSKAVLYEPAERETTALCLMHPRQDVSRHPLIPLLLERGLAVWGQTSRTVGNDLTLVHESVLLDVAAGIERLRELGYERVVLAGISGGAGLYSFYTEQAQAEAAERIAATPGGTPVPLAEAPMPAPDGLVLIAPHPGQGRLCLAMIDASAANESDPLATTGELDPYDPDNGFASEKEGGSSFAADWLDSYRAAQRERVERIDERARGMIADRIAAKKRFKAGSEDPLDSRGAVVMPIITTYRTDADPRCTDLSLDANERPYGSVISPKPQISNYGVNGFGRLTTPEAWLSTWSGISSNASLERSLPGVTVPAMVIEYTGDCSVFPSDIATALEALGSDDVSHRTVRCDHFGKPLERGEQSGIPATAAHLADWALARAGSSAPAAAAS